MNKAARSSGGSYKDKLENWKKGQKEVQFTPGPFFSLD